MPVNLPHYAPSVLAVAYVASNVAELINAKKQLVIVKNFYHFVVEKKLLNKIYLMIFISLTLSAMDEANQERIEHRRRQFLQSDTYEGIPNKKTRNIFCALSACGIAAGIGTLTIADYVRANYCMPVDNGSGCYICERGLANGLGCAECVCIPLCIFSTIGAAYLCHDCCMEKNPCYRRANRNPDLFYLSLWQKIKEKIMGRENRDE